MNIKHIRACLIACSLVVAFLPPQGLAKQNSDTAKTSVQHTAPEHDGQHDFDFEVGYLENSSKAPPAPLSRAPLTGSNLTVRTVTRKVWGGRADLEEFETDGAGRPHRRSDLASLQSPNSPVEPLLGRPARRRYGRDPRSANSRMDAASFSTRTAT